VSTEIDNAVVNGQGLFLSTIQNSDCSLKIL